jgi:hypothetical protein
LCNFWLKTYKGYKNNVDISVQTQRLYNQLPETIQSDIDALRQNTTETSMIGLAKQQLRLHISNKKQLLINHQLLRQKGLEELKIVRSSQGHHKQADIIGKIVTKEMRKADWTKIRNIFNPK